MIIDLADFLFPNDPDLLFRAIAEKRPLLLRTNRLAAFRKMLPWSVLHPLLRGERVVDGSVRVMRKSRELPPQMYSRFDNATQRRVVAEDSLQMLCDQGVSFIINGIGALVPAVGALTTDAEAALLVLPRPQRRDLRQAIAIEHSSASGRIC